MHDAPRFDALESSKLWADGRASRDPVPNTVARGRLREGQDVYYSGRVASGGYLAGLPEGVEFSEELLARGRERYNVFCSPCHGYTGYANGMIVQRGFKAPPSFHQPRLREVGLGYFYETITNGYGAMYSYAPSVKPSDRWAIAAYIRVLQQSQDMPVDELSAEEKDHLEHPEKYESHGDGHGESGHGEEGHE